MDKRFVTRIKTSLDRMLPPTRTIEGVMSVGDNQANEIIVELWKSGRKVVLESGSSYKIEARIVLPDESEINNINGSINSDGDVSVIIPANAYDTPGVIAITISLSGDPNSNHTYWGYTSTIASLRYYIESVHREG